MAGIRDSKKLYWGLIVTFFVLYALVGFVSTLHSITFFQLANAMWMAVLLGITYEVGQAAVLFSILMSDNNKKMLPWLLMILLTALQVTANVYASFKFMDGSGSMDWTYWQRSILFWLEADGPEMFKVIISWITGALLPIVALGMTALVAENLKLKDEYENKPLGGDILESAEEDEDDDFPWEKDDATEEDMQLLKDIASEVKTKEEIPLEEIGVPNAPSKPLDEEGGTPLERAIRESIKNEPEETPAVIKERIEQKRRDLMAEDLLTNKGKATIKEANATRVSPTVSVEENPLIIDFSKEQLKEGARPVEPHEDLKDLLYDEPEESSISDEEVARMDKELDAYEIPADEIDPEKLPNNPKGKKVIKKPEHRPRGWHLKREYVDTNGDIYRYGVHDPGEKDESKKA